LKIVKNIVSFNHNPPEVDFKGLEETLKETLKERFNDKDKTIRTISLNPSLRCDGDCPYCYNREDINQVTSDLNIEDFEKAIRRLREKGYEIKLSSLRLYGGEPLLTKNLADLIIHIKKEYGFSLLYVSSGLLFTDGKFQYAKEQLEQIRSSGIDLTVGVSVDFGLGDDQFTRISRTTNITRDILLNRCSEIEELGIGVVYITMISKDTNVDLLKRHIKQHYLDKNEKFDLSSMDTNSDRHLAYRITISNDDTFFPSIQTVEELKVMYDELYDELPITSNLYPYTDVIYSSIIVKLNEDNFIFLFRHSYCGIYTDMVSIFPNGEISPCHMTPFERDLTIQKECSDYLFNNEKCDNCGFFLVCRGLCPNRNLQSPDAMDSYCLWAKYSFELFIKRIFKMKGNSEKNFKDYLKRINEI
jgi:radical SAM protein with 4Fe4S-binding SPASM domain